MSWPAGIVIDTIFIPIYVVLGLLNFLNVLIHGHGRTVGFISLLLFSLVHLVGNILLVVAYNQHYSSIATTTWGYVLQSVGLSFLVSASLAFYSRARSAVESEESRSRTAKINKLLNLINFAALICIIVGYTTTSFVNAQGQVVNPTLPVETKVGAVLYILLCLGIVAMAVYGLRNVAVGSDARLLRVALVISGLVLLVRSAYSVYTICSGSVLMPKNVWVKLVLQFLSELVALVVYTGLGFVLPKVAKVEEEKDDIETIPSFAPTNESQWNEPRL